MIPLRLRPWCFTWLLVGDDHDLLKSERAAALILGPRSLAEEHPFHFAFAEVGQG